MKSRLKKVRMSTPNILFRILSQYSFSTSAGREPSTVAKEIDISINKNKKYYSQYNNRSDINNGYYEQEIM